MKGTRTRFPKMEAFSLLVNLRERNAVFSLPVSGEDHCVMTLITATKETKVEQATAGGTAGSIAAGLATQQHAGLAVQQQV